MVLALVEAAPAEVHAPGSLVASSVRSDGGRWQQGFNWRPETCPSVDTFGPCADHTKAAPAAVGLVTYIPTGFVVQDECTTLDGERDTARVRRQVEAVTSRYVAQELWTGAASTASPGTVDGADYVNPHLSDGTATAVTFSGTDRVAALAALESAAREAADGQQITLHVPVSWVLPMGDKLHRVGSVLLTPLDSLVVADAGYPEGDTAYATGRVTVRLSDIDVVSDPRFTVDRSTNRQRVLGERVFAATYDPCVHFSVTAGTPA